VGPSRRALLTDRPHLLTRTTTPTPPARNQNRNTFIRCCTARSHAGLDVQEGRDDEVDGGREGRPGVEHVREEAVLANTHDDADAAGAQSEPQYLHPLLHRSTGPMCLHGYAQRMKVLRF
jgi:hypothetical protein